MDAIRARLDSEGIEALRRGSTEYHAWCDRYARMPSEEFWAIEPSVIALHDAGGSPTVRGLAFLDASSWRDRIDHPDQYADQGD